MANAQNKKVISIMDYKNLSAKRKQDEELKKMEAYAIDLLIAISNVMAGVGNIKRCRYNAIEAYRIAIKLDKE